MVSWLEEARIDDVILAVNHLSEKLRIEIGESRRDTKITFSIEENPLGTAGPVRLAKDLLESEPFVVVNGDIVTDINLKQMIRSHTENKAKATVSLVKVPDARPYGTAEVNDAGKITKFEEKSNKRKSQTINAGVYVIDPSVIQLIPPAIPSSMEHMIFPKLVQDGAIWGWNHTGYWYDIGTIPEYLRANKELLTRFHSSHQSKISKHEGTSPPRQPEFTNDVSGSQLLQHRSQLVEATIKQPSHIGEGSVLHRGATLGPGAILSKGVAIDGGTSVRDSIIFEYTNLGRDCIVDGAIIGERVTIGAGTRIGRGAIIAGGVNIPSHSLIKQKAIILN